jgi:hypothetical protein
VYRLILVAQIRIGPMPVQRNTVEDIPTMVLAGGGRWIGVRFAVVAVVGGGEKMDRIEIVKENHAVFLQKEGEHQTRQFLVVRLKLINVITGADMAISAISAMSLSIHDTAWRAGYFHV